MSEDVYKRLALHLDQLPGTFPATESGVELRILRHLFTPEEAELAMALTLIPEEARVVALRAGMDASETEQCLERMVQKGLIYGQYPDNRPTRYMALNYVVGIWEAQLNNLDQQLVEDMDEYLETLFDFELWRKSPQLRTIPVAESIQNDKTVLPYEHAEAIIMTKDRISVAECICRKERGLVGEGCDKPLEVCFAFGNGVEFRARGGIGRQIDRTEALEILAKAQEAGLVLQPSNDKNVGFLCCCCGDCCGVLRSARRHPQPATILSSSYHAVYDAVLCSDCGDCLERCQMGALAPENGGVTLELSRCIGCGLCVTACSTGALTLVRKPDVEQPRVPNTAVEFSLGALKTRSAVSRTNLAKMVARSKLDRLRASGK